MHDRRVRGVDAALQRLQPVAFLDNLRDVPAVFRHLSPGEFRRRRHLVGRAEISPYKAAQLDRRIGGEVDVLLELVLRRLVHLVDTVTRDVEFPAVIGAPEPAFLIAPEPQRNAAVRAEFVDKADPAVAVAERDEVLAEQLDPDRRAVGLGNLRRHAGGDPISPHRLAHRRPGADAGDQFVFLWWQHRRSSWLRRRGRALQAAGHSRPAPQMCSPCPKPTSAASPRASPRVGWTWIVCARSSSTAPIASACANSPASSAISRPTAWMPRMRRSARSDTTRTNPPLSPASKVKARPLAANGKTEVSASKPAEAASMPKPRSF